MASEFRNLIAHVSCINIAPEVLSAKLEADQSASKQLRLVYNTDYNNYNRCNLVRTCGWYSRGWYLCMCHVDIRHSFYVHNRHV